MTQFRGAIPEGRQQQPGLRPKEIGHVGELAREHTEEAITTLVELMRTAKTDSARAAAPSELLKQGMGKAKSGTGTHTLKDEHLRLDFSMFTEEEQEAIRPQTASVQVLIGRGVPVKVGQPRR